MVKWFEENGRQRASRTRCRAGGETVVAIYDATNSTKERRRTILRTCQESEIELFFVESICDDESLIRENVLEVKISSPDYRDVEPADAVDDFMKRYYAYFPSHSHSRTRLHIHYSR